MTSPQDPDSAPAQRAPWASPGGPVGTPTAPAPRLREEGPPAPLLTPAGPPAPSMSSPAPRTDAAPSAPGGGLAITATVLGGLGLLLAGIPFACFAAFIPATGGIVFGAAALVRGAARRGLAITGLVTGTVAVPIALVMSIVTFGVVGDIARDIESTGGWDQLLEGSGIDPETGPFLVSESVELRGDGADSVGVVPVDGRGTYGYARITARGTGTFIVIARDSTGAEVERLVDTTAPYDGAVLWNTVADIEVVEFDIIADESWSVSLQSVDLIPEIADGGSIDGTGDTVLWYPGDDTGLRLAPADDVSAWLWATGDDFLWLCDTDPGEPCDSGLTGSDYGSIVQIVADGAWKLSLGGSAVPGSIT